MVDINSARQHTHSNTSIFMAIQSLLQFTDCTRSPVLADSRVEYFSIATLRAKCSLAMAKESQMLRKLNEKWN